MPWVYLLTNKAHGTLYIGCTVDIRRRLEQHLSGIGSVFTAKYQLNRLVHSEEYSELSAAQAREHHLKQWRRDWKIALVETHNPDWRDLASLLT